MFHLLEAFDECTFGWDDDYLHEFTVHGVTYGTTGGAHRRGDDVRLVDLRLRERERFVYGYNFFAGWFHDLRVEKNGPAQPRRRYPRCLAGARRVPPSRTSTGTTTDACMANSDASPTEHGALHAMTHPVTETLKPENPLSIKPGP